MEELKELEKFKKKVLTKFKKYIYFVDYIMIENNFEMIFKFKNGITISYPDKYEDFVKDKQEIIQTLEDFIKKEVQ